MMPVQTDLIRVVQQLSFCRDLDAVLAVLRTAARDLTGADGVTVVLRDGDLCHYAEENAVGPLWKGRRFPMSACISGWCMLHREQVVIDDIYADARIPHDAYRPTFVQSLAMTPIRAADPLGAIGAYWGTCRRATPDELNVLQALGDSAAVAFANVALIDTLRQTNRRKDEFLSMLAHELRNPLAPLLNALHIFRLVGGSTGPVAETRGMMERQVDHLTRIIDGLLDVARLTNGKIVLDRGRLDLAALVRQTVEDRRGVLAAAGIELGVDVPDAAVWAVADGTRIAQALNNLLDNAAKFTPRGGRVGVRLTPNDATGQAEIVVTDTGSGIDPAVLPHLFEAFTQAERIMDSARGGLGLGLAVARGFVELHGGTLRAASDGPGRGAEFTVTLPCEVDATGQHAAAPELVGCATP